MVPELLRPPVNVVPIANTPAASVITPLFVMSVVFAPIAKIPTAEVPEMRPELVIFPTTVENATPTP